MVRHSITVGVTAALLLSGCATDATFKIAGRTPDPEAFEEDASDCSSVGHSVARFFGATLVGAGNGAYLGAASGGSGDAALVGAAGGAVVGLFFGVITGAID